MSDMVSNGYLKDKNGKVMEIVDKAARDGVERLTEEIKKLKGEDGSGGTASIIKPTWLYQNINDQGQLSNSTHIRVSAEFDTIPDGGITITKTDEAYKATVYQFSSDDTLTKYWMEANETSFTVTSDYVLFRICVSRTDNAELTIEAVDAVFTFISGSDTTENEETEYSNALKGKKWAVCGDSFTAGDFTGDVDEADSKFTSGAFIGQNKVYARHIAMRNDMTLQWMAAGGKTLANPADGSFYNSFTNLNSTTGNTSWKNYQDIDEDVDYITFYFGINDSHHEAGSTGDDGESKEGEIPLGTIDDADTSTFYGAWNVMLPWLMENRPFAHMGILVSNGCDRDAYRTATIEIAKKWGVPYIDLNGDERTPVMLRSTNPDVCSAVKTIKHAQQRVSETNGHPNVKTHLYESWFIEDFLRSL